MKSHSKVQVYNEHTIRLSILLNTIYTHSETYKSEKKLNTKYQNYSQKQNFNLHYPTFIALDLSRLFTRRSGGWAASSTTKRYCKAGCCWESQSSRINQHQIMSDPSLCADLRSLSLAWGGPVVPRPPDQVAAGHLQVPLVPGEDLYTVLFGAEAQRVQLLQLGKHKCLRSSKKYCW